MSNHHPEENFFAQLQLALTPVAAGSNPVPTFRFQDAYWEFLDRALHFIMPETYTCRCTTCSGWSHHYQRGRRARTQRDHDEPPFSRLRNGVTASAPFAAPYKQNSQCVMCFDVLAPLRLETKFIEHFVSTQALGSDARLFPCGSDSCDTETLPRGITCPRGHVICRGCLDSLIVERCSSVLHTPSTPSTICCPTCQATNSLGRFVFERSRQDGGVWSYTEEQLKRACGGASQHALQLLESVAEADEKLAALPESEQITNGNTDCYLCPKCKFGPVAHLACDDLSAHHGLQGVSNKCPECGFLAHHISEWIRIAEPRLPALSIPPLPVHDRHDPIIHSLWPTDDDSDLMSALMRLRNVRSHNTANQWGRMRWRMPEIIHFPPVSLDFFFPPREVAPLPFLHGCASYWDHAMRRLLRTALLVTAPAPAPSTSAINEAKEIHRLSTTGEGGMQLSLVQARHSCCLRVASIEHHHVTNQWNASDCKVSLLLLLPHLPNVLPALYMSAGLCAQVLSRMIVIDSTRHASVSRKLQLAVECGAVSGGKETGPGTQLAYVRVV
jgi:hypothetical protein